MEYLGKKGKEMKKGNSRKWLKGIILLAIIIAIIIGIVFFFKSRKPKEVPVFSLNEAGGEDYWQNESSSQGSIKEDKMQSVYVSKTQKVDKILVKEGQTVKQGDVLLTYNTTLSTLELERKQLRYQKTRNRFRQSPKRTSSNSNLSARCPNLWTITRRETANCR